MFWKHKDNSGNGNLSGPKEMPELVGRYLVVEDRKDPDWVWSLKGVVRQVGKKEFYCRVFSDAQVAKAGVRVRDWTSLDGHPELVLWEGYFNKETFIARPEKFKDSSASNPAK